MAEVSSLNTWSNQESLLGVRLGDPQSALTLARRHGLLDIEANTQVGYQPLPQTLELYVTSDYRSVCNIGLCTSLWVSLYYDWYE